MNVLGLPHLLLSATTPVCAAGMAPRWRQDGGNMCRREHFPGMSGLLGASATMLSLSGTDVRTIARAATLG